MKPVELRSLLIKEVSGVDDPANEIPGWMVQKASKFKSSLSIGPDQTWDVAAAEKRVRAATKATTGPNPAYAACFLWYDGAADDADGDGVPDDFGSYKFLVCDEVDGKLQAMPAAIRAAASRLSGSSLSDADKTSVQAVIDKLETKAGIGDTASKAAPSEDAPTFVTRLKHALSAATGKEHDDMTPDELKAAVGEGNADLVKSIGALVEVVTKSVTPVEGAAPAAAPEAVAPAVTMEAIETAITAGIEAGLQKAIEGDENGDGLNGVIASIADRVANTEKAFGIAARSSLDGQESGAGATPATKSKDAPAAMTGVQSAISKALRTPGQPVFLAGTPGDGSLGR